MLPVSLTPKVSLFQLRLNANVAELNMRDCVAKYPGSAYDGAYYGMLGLREFLVERSRFEGNGNRVPTSAGSGPCKLVMLSRFACPSR